jgi:hypothetical protein
MGDKDLFTSLLSQGFAVLVAGWLLLRLETVLKELARQVGVNTRATLLSAINDPQASPASKEQAKAMTEETRPKNGQSS